MMTRPLHALLIEDSEDDALLLLQELERLGYAVSSERVDTMAGTREALARGGWDIIFADYSLPTFNAKVALTILHEVGKDIPFVIISGTVGEETAVEALRAGAHDFLVKGRLARLQPIIERELREAKLRLKQITERQHAEAERTRLLEELREAVQARDAFLAIAAHELRTPLTSLQLQIQSLDVPSRRELLSTMPVDRLESKIALISRQTTRLGSLLTNLLDVGRITSDALVLCRETVDLGGVVAQVITNSEELLRQSGCALAIRTEKVLGRWDSLRVETVVTNLISNAAKFGAGQPVDVSVSRDHRMAQLVVTDRGIGISPEEQARIFKKFERAVPDKHYGGLGLGLWVTRQIVEAHGGTIQVRSEKGRGSTFIVELPLFEPDSSSVAQSLT